MKTVNGEILFGEEESRARSVFDDTTHSDDKKKNRRGSNRADDQSVHKSKTLISMLSDPRYKHNRVRMLHLLACAVYVISPIDLIPDFILGLGQVDDIVVAGYGLKVVMDLVKDLRVYKSLKD